MTTTIDLWIYIAIVTGLVVVELILLWVLTRQRDSSPPSHNPDSAGYKRDV